MFLFTVFLVVVLVVGFLIVSVVVGSFRNPVGAHGGERKTACQGAFIFISLTVGSVSWWYVEVVPVS